MKNKGAYERRPKNKENRFFLFIYLFSGREQLYIYIYKIHINI